MKSNAPEIWKELQNNFQQMNNQEIKATLCRLQHYQNEEVKNLRQHEAPVKKWLDERRINASKVYQWVTRNKKSNYAERYTKKRLEEKWRKLVEIQTELIRVLPDKTPEEIRTHVRKITRWTYGEVKDLSQDEFILRDVILRMNIKPGTLYNWMIHTIVPEHNKQQLEQGIISTSMAEKMLKNRERQQKIALQIRLLEDAKLMVKDVLA